MKKFIAIAVVSFLIGIAMMFYSYHVTRSIHPVNAHIQLIEELSQ